MAFNLGDQTNIDKSDLAKYPNGQIKDNSGSDDGTPVNRETSSDLWIFFDKLMRLAGIAYNGDYDNEANGYQYVQAAIALASKSDYVLSLTTSGGKLQVPTKLGTLQENEKMLLLAVSDLGAETLIVGSDAVEKTIIITQQWKAGDYLLMVNTAGGVKIIQWLTGDNINVVVAANNFLKAANNAATLAGLITTAAVTPASLLYAVDKFLTDDVESVPFLATDTNNGLLSAEDKIIIDGFVNKVKNVGTFSGVVPGSGTIGSFAPRTGNVVSAQISSSEAGTPGSTTYLVTLANAMSGTYFVRTSIQSDGTLNLDNDILCPVWRPLTSTTFSWSLQGAVGGGQSLTIFIEVVQV